jgi:hypothetical protein
MCANKDRGDMLHAACLSLNKGQILMKGGEVWDSYKDLTYRFPRPFSDKKLGA